MWIEFLIGATLLAVLWTQREHMATGVYDKQQPPTDTEASEIFDQVMWMSPSILHDAYTDALVLAKSALAEAKTFAARDPNDPMLKGATTMTDDTVTQLSKNAVTFAVILPGQELKRQQKPITEASLRTLVEELYTKLNQHIDDALPPIVSSPTDTQVKKDAVVKMREYAERARTLVRKYNTTQVKEACILVLKEYYVDQLKPGWTPSGSGGGGGGGTAPDPTAAGNMSELEAEYQSRKIVYDNLVASALATNDSSMTNEIAAAKQAMNDTLSKMLALSAKTGTDSQQQELIHRIMEIQHDYNELLVGTDKLQTLRLLHQTLDVRDSFGLKLFGGFFVVAALAVLVLVMRTR